MYCIVRLTKFGMQSCFIRALIEVKKTISGKDKVNCFVKYSSQVVEEKVAIYDLDTHEYIDIGLKEVIFMMHNQYLNVTGNVIIEDITANKKKIKFVITQSDSILFSKRVIINKINISGKELCGLSDGTLHRSYFPDDNWHDYYEYDSRDKVVGKTIQGVTDQSYDKLKIKYVVSHPALSYYTGLRCFDSMVYARLVKFEDRLDKNEHYFALALNGVIVSIEKVDRANSHHQMYNFIEYDILFCCCARYKNSLQGIMRVASDQGHPCVDERDNRLFDCVVLFSMELINNELTGNIKLRGFHNELVSMKIPKIGGGYASGIFGREKSCI